MTGDGIVQSPTFNATTAVEVDARPDQIWRWTGLEPRARSLGPT
jgi:hypothetical protein